MENVSLPRLIINYFSFADRSAAGGVSDGLHLLGDCWKCIRPPLASNGISTVNALVEASARIKGIYGNYAISIGGFIFNYAFQIVKLMKA